MLCDGKTLSLGLPRGTIKNLSKIKRKWLSGYQIKPNYMGFFNVVTRERPLEPKIVIFTYLRAVVSFLELGLWLKFCNAKF